MIFKAYDRNGLKYLTNLFVVVKINPFLKSVISTEVYSKFSKISEHVALTCGNNITEICNLRTVVLFILQLMFSFS